MEDYSEKIQTLEKRIKALESYNYSSGAKDTDIEKHIFRLKERIKELEAEKKH
jgi:phage shock protein A